MMTSREPSGGTGQDSCGGRRPTVLLVEDNLTQLDLYAMVLQDEFDVLRATRGETAYALACEYRPDAIVMDVLLPDADGLAVCDQLRANPATARIPIIILTGDDSAYARAKLQRSALNALFMKPCPADRLLAVLREATVKSH